MVLMKMDCDTTILRGRRLGFFFCVLLILIHSAFVSSANETGRLNMAESVEKLGDSLSNFFIWLFNSAFGSLDFIFDALEGNDVLITKLLYAALLIAIIYSVIDMANLIPQKNQWIQLVLSIVIGSIAFIALPDGFIELLIPSYESMFLTLFSSLPFGLILYFSIKVKSPTVGRILWAFATAYFIVLAVNEGYPAYRAGEYIQALIYFTLAVFGILLVIFLPSVRSWIFKAEAKELTQEMEAMADIESALQKGSKRKAEALVDIAHDE